MTSKFLVKTLAITAILTLCHTAASAQSSYAEQGKIREDSCFTSVQGKVAWSRGGSKTWSPSNVRALCQGTPNAYETVACFKRGIEAHNDWNKAIQACRSDINSYKEQDAAREDRCFDAVQGKVAWSRGGSKTWNPANIRNLCKDTRNVERTVDCFKRGIIDHNNWGKAINACQSNPNSYLNVSLSSGSTPSVQSTPAPAQVAPPKPKESAAEICTRRIKSEASYNQSGRSNWHDNDAKQICYGTSNPDTRISCFQKGVQSHNDWREAARDCRRNDKTYNGGSPSNRGLTENGVTGKNVVEIHYKRFKLGTSEVYKTGKFVETQGDPDIWHWIIDDKTTGDLIFEVIKRYDGTLVLKNTGRITTGGRINNEYVFEINTASKDIRGTDVGGSDNQHVRTRDKRLFFTGKVTRQYR